MQYDPEQLFYESAKCPASAYMVTARGVEDAIRAADVFCLRLFCDTHTGCRVCPGCKKFLSGNTVDFLVLGTQDPVSMTDVRALPAFLSVASYERGYRCIHIKNAQNLTPQIQNYLLKILEEPPQGVVFVLSLDNKERLLPTVRSRCFEVHIPPNAKTEIIRRLEGEVKKERIGYAAAWSYGSYADAIKLAEDEELVQIRERAVNVCLRMASGRTPSFFTMEKDISAAGKRLLDMLFAMVSLLRDAVLLKMGVGQVMNPDKLGALRKMQRGFTLCQLRCIINLINKACEKKQESPWLRDDLLIKGLLLDILEVRHGKCNRSSV